MSGTKEDADESLRYLKELADGVEKGIAAGRTLTDIRKSLTLDAFKGFEQWDTVREAHTASVYASLKGTR